MLDLLTVVGQLTLGHRLTDLRPPQLFENLIGLTRSEVALKSPVQLTTLIASHLSCMTSIVAIFCCKILLIFRNCLERRSYMLPTKLNLSSDTQRLKRYGE